MASAGQATAHNPQAVHDAIANRKGDKPLMVLSTSTPVPPEVVTQLRETDGVVDARHAVVQLDSCPQLLAQPTRHRPGHRRQVGLGHLVAGVGQMVGELAVIGQQQQPRRVGVEPSHGIEAAGGPDEIHDFRPAP